LLKIVLLGGGGVGKSALTIQFVQHIFVSEYDPTIENSYRKQIAFEKEAYVLEIFDTAGQEEYSALRSQYIDTGSGFLLVYNIASKSSFQLVTDFKKQILQVKDRPYWPIVLVGNKADIEPHERRVTTEQGQELANSWGCGFFETSAKTRLNLEEAFFYLVRDMLDFNKKGLNSTVGGLAGLDKKKESEKEKKRSKKRSTELRVPLKSNRVQSDPGPTTDSAPRKLFRCSLM